MLTLSHLTGETAVAGHIANMGRQALLVEQCLLDPITLNIPYRTSQKWQTSTHTAQTRNDPTRDDSIDRTSITSEMHVITTLFISNAQQTIELYLTEHVIWLQASYSASYSAESC